MHELLNAFIIKKENEKKEKKEQEKNRLLLSKGLFEKVYSESDNYDANYPFSDWKDGKTYYYKKSPIEITDSEYEKLKELCESDEQKEEESNAVASTLQVIATLIFIGGFIAGIALGFVEVTKGNYFTYTTTEFSFPVALTYWAASFISGMLFIGFAEVIKLLNSIKKFLK